MNSMLHKLLLHEMYVEYRYDNKVFKKILASIYYGRRRQN